MKNLIAILSFLVLSACGSTNLNYAPKSIEYDAAAKDVEMFVMTQHRAFKPQDFLIADDYLGWSFGAVAQGNFVGFANNGIAIGSTSSRIQNLNERVYFEQIAAVELYSWKRKAKQWYLVTLEDSRGVIISYFFRTRVLEDAERLTDALTSVINKKIKDTETSK